MPQVRLIKEDGTQVGVVPFEEAATMARATGLDLVEIAPTANPPVVKLIDYGKFLYQEEKSERKQRAKAKGGEIKGVRITMRISANDLEHKIKQAEKFLNESNKVRVELVMRGREKYQFQDRARAHLEAFIQRITIPTVIEQPPKRQGRGIAATIAKK
ncbi:translation initiation factor IF-3 [Candidatus Parcubacteria bacterium]|nr:translation initiation factor IF-3 [Candidatus Parcubacteria bacterium]